MIRRWRARRNGISRTLTTSLDGMPITITAIEPGSPLDKAMDRAPQRTRTYESRYDPAEWQPDPGDWVETSHN